MKYFLDTNICIYLIKRKPLSLIHKFTAYQIGDIGISSITAAELQFGVQKSQRSQQNQRALEQFFMPLTIAEFNVEASVVYGKIRAHLEQQGTPIGALDTLIAAHAMSLNATLITNNVREFARVPHLQVEN